jgi:protein-tyrosine phosphatase
MSELSILVVCLGNVCRSPLAERMLRKRFDELLGDGADAVQVSSAGVWALVGEPMDASSADELARLGGDPSDFAARQVDAAMTDDADLILTATRELRSRVLEESPRALKRSFTMCEFAALATSDAFRERRPASAADLIRRAAAWRGSADIEDYDVPDPIGQSPECHREVADLLERECTAIARAVVGALLSEH